MARSEILQQLWREYEDCHDNAATSVREVVDWAVRNRALPLPAIDPRDVLATQMSRALREEFAVDAQGRRYRVNHAIRVMKNGVQHTIWGILGHADADFMRQAFRQRREQIVRDLMSLKTDIDVYNSLVPAQSPIQLELDFTADITQRLALAG